MNEEDKKRFARYRPGYIEPEEEEIEDEDVVKKPSAEAATKLGFVDNIKIDGDDLVSQVIREMEENPKTEAKTLPIDLKKLPTNIKSQFKPIAKKS